MKGSFSEFLVLTHPLLWLYSAILLINKIGRTLLILYWRNKELLSRLYKLPFFLIVANSSFSIVGVATPYKSCATNERWDAPTMFLKENRKQSVNSYMFLQNIEHRQIYLRKNSGYHKNRNYPPATSPKQEFCQYARLVALGETYRLFQEYVS